MNHRDSLLSPRAWCSLATFRLSTAFVALVLGASHAHAQIEPGRLVPDDILAANFGESVSISGTTAVVGAPQTPTGETSQRLGAAYVFERDALAPSGWTHVATLLPTDITTSESQFGFSVSINGDTILVGDVGNRNKIAYIFERHQGGMNAWGMVATLPANDPDVGDAFGTSVSISGDVAIVGAGEGFPTRGAVYVYARNHDGPNLWGRVAKLTASDGGPGDTFGSSVSISGQTIIVGAPQLQAAYIFEPDAGDPNAWRQIMKVTPPDTPPGRFFGSSVAVNGDTAIVGAPFLRGEGGAAYVFARRADNQWSGVQKLVPALSSGSRASRFGASVALGPELALVSDILDDEKGGFGQESGSAFLFRRSQGNGDSWIELAKLTASDGGRPEGDRFGASMSISGTTALIGAPGGGDGRAYACNLEALRTDAGACRRAIPVLNDLVTASNLSTSCCDGSAFLITATFLNAAGIPIVDPFFEVFYLTGGNLVENADGGPGGIGSAVTPPARQLLPGESVTVTFRIRLVTRDPFQFLVRLRGDLLEQ